MLTRTLICEGCGTVYKPKPTDPPRPNDWFVLQKVGDDDPALHDLCNLCAGKALAFAPKKRPPRKPPAATTTGNRATRRAAAKKPS